MFVTKAPKETQRTRDAVCPSCGNAGAFIYIGEQFVPQRVADILDITGKAIELWDCTGCGSTISGPSLLDNVQ
jgi:ribosomal protein L37AE/L43A